MTDEFNSLMRNNNWNVKSPKVQEIIPNAYEIYKEGNHMINMRQFHKYLTINMMSLETHENPDNIFFYGSKDINMSIMSVYNILSVFLLERNCGHQLESLYQRNGKRKQRRCT